VLLGPILKKKADEKRLVLLPRVWRSTGIICEMVDWAADDRLEVVCAGKGRATSQNIVIRRQTTVWKYFGFTEEEIADRQL